MTETRTTGFTAEGVRVVVIHADRSADDAVYVGGERMRVLNVRLMRDGGTTHYDTDRGTLTLPHRIGNPDRTPRWTPRVGVH